jgi:hypothetical protein
MAHNQQLAERPQGGLQKTVQTVTKVQYPCGQAAVFAIPANVKI